MPSSCPKSRILHVCTPGWPGPQLAGACCHDLHVLRSETDSWVGQWPVACTCLVACATMRPRRWHTEVHLTFQGC